VRWFGGVIITGEKTPGGGPNAAVCQHIKQWNQYAQDLRRARF